MKKMIIGACFVICGFIVNCTQYLETTIIEAMPDAVVVNYGNSYIIGTAMFLIGLVFLWIGYGGKE